MSKDDEAPMDTLPSEGKVEIVISSSNKKLDVRERTRRLKLYQAALNGDSSYEVHPEDITATLSKEGNTALHIATAAENSDFAIKLVGKMRKEDLEMKNMAGNTVFCLAAISGKVELAKEMMKKHNGLPKIPGIGQMLPIYLAALFGRKDMVNYLYDTNGRIDGIDLTSEDDIVMLCNMIKSGLYEIDLRSDDAINLLRCVIKSGLYEIPLELAKRLKDKPLDTARHENLELKLLQTLAQMPPATHSPQQGFWNRSFNIFSCTNKKKASQARQLVEELWKQVILSEASEFHHIIRNASRLIFAAAKQGNTQFLSILTGEYPDLMLEIESCDNKYTIFHDAVKNRHNDVFKFIYKIGSFKDLIVPYEDEEKNNILHLAAKLAPPERLNVVYGTALQMQRELLWFEEVRKTVNISYTEIENRKGLTPRALFTEEHSELKEKGEKWMRATANSCMIVATLIATVVFAAAFTVPGGTREESGSPNFLRKASFTIFAISDAISLVSSSCSILTFLSILTSRYAEDDFIWRLPTKLLVGVTTLFVSIIAMMVVFSATFFIVFNDGLLGCAVLTSSIASIPVFLFLFLQSHLLLDVVRPTYFSFFSL